MSFWLEFARFSGVWGKLPRVGGKIPQGILPPQGASCPGGQDKLLHRTTAIDYSTNFVTWVYIVKVGRFQYSVLYIIVQVIFYFLWDHWAHPGCFENRIPLKPALGGICSLANYSVTYEESQSNRVSDFRDFVYCLFPKAILFDFYFTNISAGSPVVYWYLTKTMYTSEKSK